MCYFLKGICVDGGGDGRDVFIVRRGGVVYVFVDGNWWWIGVFVCCYLDG